MPEYKVIARRYRPQVFADVLGQEAIVTTLKNAIKNHRLAHAYLFCGSRGTGKTTLARILAKAINCQSPSTDFEPCNCCSSCKEIIAGTSLDILEIDGASHRGIDDIRQINDTVGYAAASGKDKIYIIDEVHMLTKEAFNALLKTLEEPPSRVKFFFATTEPHKVPATILSRCQRFNLNRIPLQSIVGKLKRIADESNIAIEEEALQLIAERAEGGLRDAESLLDQICAFQEGKITAESVASILGLVTRDTFFALDLAGKEMNLAASFDIAEQVFSQGKDVMQFLEGLTEHFRNILCVKLSERQAGNHRDRERYEASAKLYSQEQCLTILDFLIEAQNQKAVLGKIALEAILLRILRIRQRIPIELLVRRLTELEQKIAGTHENKPTMPVERQPEPPAPISKAMPIPKEPPVQSPKRSITEDPTPSPADLGIKVKPTDPQQKNIEAVKISPEQQRKHDTLLQFAAIELEGTMQKKPINYR